jgi:hypothetical protein
MQVFRATQQAAAQITAIARIELDIRQLLQLKLANLERAAALQQRVEVIDGSYR